jgi:hypothetical protein
MGDLGEKRIGGSFRVDALTIETNRAATRESWYARMADSEGYWAHGRTEEEAIGKLVVSLASTVTREAPPVFAPVSFVYGVVDELTDPAYAHSSGVERRRDDVKLFACVHANFNVVVGDRLVRVPEGFRPRARTFFMEQGIPETITRTMSCSIDTEGWVLSNLTHRAGEQIVLSALYSIR